MTQKKKLSSQKKDLDLLTRMRNFNRRWNIASDEEEDSRKFKNRVLTTVDKVVGGYCLANPQVSIEYALLLGYNLPPSATTGSYTALLVLGRNFENDPVYKILAGATDFRNFVTSIQALFWTLEKYDCPNISELADGIQTAINYTPNVSLRIFKKNKTVTLYPGGAKILDNELVNQSLSWLEGRPSVAKHYQQALSIYLSKDESKYRNLLDNLRLSLEELLRAVLGNKKSLENQKLILRPWLRNCGVHPQIINMYDDLLARFMQYQNDAVKHGDNWSSIEIEFMIYLTGAFMRLLLQLER